MNRRHLFLFALATVAAGPVWAGYEDDIIAALRRQGYTQISVTTTWLGRIRITAFRNSGQREIVLNPRTGEILRDLWLTKGGANSVSNSPEFADTTTTKNTASTNSGGGDDLSGSDDGGSGDGGSGDGASGGTSDGGPGNSGSGSDSGGSDDQEDDRQEDGSDDQGSGGKDD